VTLHDMLLGELYRIFVFYRHIWRFLHFIDTIRCVIYMC
jgi:hypothetical protein